MNTLGLSLVIVTDTHYPQNHFGNIFSETFIAVDLIFYSFFNYTQLIVCASYRCFVKNSDKGKI